MVKKRRMNGCGWLVLVAIAVVVGLGILGTVAGSPSHKSGTLPQPTDIPATTPKGWNVALDGSIPSVQTVGDAVNLSVTAQNRGQDITHLVLAFDGLGSWVIDGVHGCNGDGKPLDGYGNPYDFGPVPSGGMCPITLDLSAKDAGNHTISVLTYHDISGNQIDTSTDVGDPAASVEWSVAINP